MRGVQAVREYFMATQIAYSNEETLTNSESEGASSDDKSEDLSEFSDNDEKKE